MTEASLFYRRFEDRYRGSRELIMKRLHGYRSYLGALVDHHGPSAQGLDLGCGRGEWLEVVGEAGLQARGVDLDPSMLAACAERRLSATHGDAIDALEGCADASLALVTGFHIAEHLEFDVLRKLIAEAYRVLAPGGLLILETPNPENLRVSAVDFYMDPTHRHPLPPRLLSFAVEFVGFDPCYILRLQEPASAHDTAHPSARQIYNDASPDYAVIAGKCCSSHLRRILREGADRQSGVTAELLMDRRDHAVQAERLAIESRVDALAADLSDCREQEAQRAAALEIRLTALDERLTAVFDSRSWRITAPLRTMGELIRALKSGLRALPTRITRRVICSGQLWAFLYRHPRLHALARQTVRRLGIEGLLLRLLGKSDKIQGFSADTQSEADLPRHAQRVYRRLKDKCE